MRNFLFKSLAVILAVLAMGIVLPVSSFVFYQPDIPAELRK